MSETQKKRIARVVREVVDIRPADPRWPDLFQEEKKHLIACLPNELIKRIEHFGSTSVPGLTAKPVIDMLIEVTDLDETRRRIVPILESQGYDYFWRPAHDDDQPPFYAWFIKRDPGGQRTHHIHMVDCTFEHHWDRLYFRDYLREHPDIAKEYGALKIKLGAEHHTDRVAYSRAKAEFIEKITALAKDYYPKA